MAINCIVVQDGEIEFLNQLIAAVLDGAEMHLGASNITITPTTDLATLTAGEATFAGYAEQSLSTWTTPTIQGDGSAGSSPATPSFTPSSSLGSGTLYYGWVANIGDTQPLWAWNFATGGISISYGLSLDIAVLFTVLSRY